MRITSLPCLLWGLAVSAALCQDAEPEQESASVVSPRAFGCGSLQTVACSPDGRLCATGGSAGAFLWDLASGRLVRRVTDQTSTVDCLRFSPDGRWLLTGSAFTPARVVEVASGRTIRELGSPASQAVWSPDGSQVLTLAHQHLPILTDLRSGDAHPISTNQVALGARAAFSDDGRLLAFATPAAVRLLYLDETSQVERAQPVKGTRGKVLALAFRPVTQDFLLCLEDGSMFQLTPSPEENALVRLGSLGLRGWASMTLQADGSRLLVKENGRNGGRMTVWQPAGRERLAGFTNVFWDGHLQTAATWSRTREAWVPGTGQLLTADRDHQVRLWDPASGEVVRTLGHHAERERPMAVSRDGKRVLTLDRQLGFSQCLFAWDLASGERVSTLGDKTLLTNAATVTNIVSVTLSDDGRHAAVGYESGLVQLWEVETGTWLRSIEASPRPTAQPSRFGQLSRTRFPSRPRSVADLVFLPSEGQLLVAFDDARVMLCDWRTSEVLKEIHPRGREDPRYGRVPPLRVSLVRAPDGSRVAVNIRKLDQAWISVCDVKTGSLLTTLRPAETVTHDLTVAYEGTGNRVVVAWHSPQLTLTRWSVRPTGQLSRCEATIFPAVQTAFHEQGTRLLVAAGNRLMDLDSRSGEVLHDTELQRSIETLIPLEDSGVFLIADGRGITTLMEWAGDNGGPGRRDGAIEDVQ